MLIALQTVAVAMDDHKPHESDDENLIQVLEKEQNSTDQKPQPSDTQSDCSHYCQCHSLVKFFKNPSDDLDEKISSIKMNHGNVNYTSIYTLLYLPPPIS